MVRALVVTMVASIPLVSAESAVDAPAAIANDRTMLYGAEIHVRLR